MNSDRLELIVNTNDSYLEDNGVFYVNPFRLNLIRCLTDNQFSSCLIQNSPVETLTSLNLSYVLRKLKVNSILEVIVHQPISVMQEYDAKQIVANASLAGFVDAEIKQREYVDNANIKFKTLAVTLRKPEKNPNVIEFEVTLPVKKISKSNEDNQKNETGKGKVTTTTKTTTKTKTVVKKK